MTKVEGNSFSFRHPYGILYRGTVDGWKAMGDGHFGWSFKDGVLSNRIKRDAAGKRVGGDVNLISKRSAMGCFQMYT